MKKRFAILMLALFCSAASAADLPRIAVYVTGDVPDNEKSALGTRMLASLVNSGRYKGIERASGFLAEIEKEMVKQRSGDIDDGQISELGKQFGVRFVCIAAITPAFGSFQVSARIINVETAEVEFIGDASSPLKTMDDLTEVSEKVVNNMFRGQPAPAALTPATPEPPEPIPPTAQPSPQNPAKRSLWLGLSANALGAGIIAYGIIENGRASNSIDKQEYSKAKKSIANRNAAYAIGAAALLGGISIHIFF
jgi:hypothetical protein